MTSAAQQKIILASDSTFGRVGITSCRSCIVRAEPEKGSSFGALHTRLYLFRWAFSLKFCSILVWACPADFCEWQTDSKSQWKFFPSTLRDRRNNTPQLPSVAEWLFDGLVLRFRGMGEPRMAKIFKMTTPWRSRRSSGENHWILSSGYAEHQLGSTYLRSRNKLYIGHALDVSKVWNV